MPWSVFLTKCTSPPLHHGHASLVWLDRSGRARLDLAGLRLDGTQLTRSVVAGGRAFFLAARGGGGVPAPSPWIRWWITVASFYVHYVGAGSVFFRTGPRRAGQKMKNALRLGAVSFGAGAVTVRTNVMNDSKHNTRKPPFFQLPATNTSLMLNSPLYQAADTFNSLPAVLQSASSLTFFKTVPHYSYSHANVHAVSTLVSK